LGVRPPMGWIFQVEFDDSEHRELTSRINRIYYNLRNGVELEAVRLDMLMRKDMLLARRREVRRRGVFIQPFGRVA